MRTRVPAMGASTTTVLGQRFGCSSNISAKSHHHHAKLGYARAAGARGVRRSHHPAMLVKRPRDRRMTFEELVRAAIDSGFDVDETSPGYWWFDPPKDGPYAGQGFSTPTPRDRRDLTVLGYQLSARGLRYP